MWKSTSERKKRKERACAHNKSKMNCECGNQQVQERSKKHETKRDDAWEFYDIRMIHENHEGNKTWLKRVNVRGRGKEKKRIEWEWARQAPPFSLFPFHAAL